MAAELEFAKLNINKTEENPSSVVESKAVCRKNKRGKKHKINKYELEQDILEPDAHLTYLEFLERNPLRLSMQKLKGRMDYRPQKKTELDRIEETYWTQWKPKNNNVLMEPAKVEVKKTALKTQKNTKGECDRNYNKKNDSNDPHESKKISKPLESKRSEPLSKIDELTEDDKEIDITSNVEEFKDSGFLKHTDSLILNNKRQSEEKSHYQQPRCIRLYKKTSSSNYVRGGSYPLKPCLKKESSLKSYSRRTLSSSPFTASIFKSGKNKMKSISTK